MKQPHPREELRWDQCAYCHQEGHWKNECPQWPRDLQKATLTRGRGRVVGGKYHPAQGRSNPWEEDIIGLATFEDCEEDWDRPGSTLLGLPGSYGLNEDRGPSH
jgi:hypothetical protein